MEIKICQQYLVSGMLLPTSVGCYAIICKINAMEKMNYHLKYRGDNAFIMVKFNVYLFSMYLYGLIQNLVKYIHV